jgi:hypothetical protein
MQYENFDPAAGDEWSDALDAVAAAPDHHNIIFENEHVRVLDTRIGPGETTPVHTHRWPSVVYTLQTCDFVRVSAVDRSVLDTRIHPIIIELNTPKHIAPLRPHSIRNVGDKEIRAIAIEIKDRTFR